MNTPEVFLARHKVRTYECDLYGHVNNATYLNFLEFGRMEALEAKGFTLERLKKMGFMVVVRSIEIEYKAPATEGDWLLIKTAMDSYRKTSGTFRQEIIREKDNKLIALARVAWVFTNLEGKPIPIPEVIKEAFKIDEKPQPVKL